MNIINSKIFRFLVLVYIIGVIFGIVSFVICDTSIVSDSIISYFDLFSGDIKYVDCILNSFYFSFKNSFFIFICGLLIFGVVLIPLLIIFKGIFDCLIIIGIIECFHIKGLILGFILCLFSILVKNFVYFILSYYSFSISIKEIKVIKDNKNIHFNLFYKNYILRYIILFIFLLFINVFEVYILSNIIKYIIM